jgi:hypothetical protein
VRLSISATGVYIVNDTVYITINDRGLCKIAVFKDGSIHEALVLKDSPCLILRGLSEGLLISSGNILYLVSGDEAKPLLRTKAGNIFWHATEACNKLFVQEYGEDPTGIYVSEDLKSFRGVVTNRDIDPSSRHFHYITFDKEREILITTLGDGNIVRVAISTDCGSSWRPLYKGPW